MRATRAALESVGRLETPAGQLALTLAARCDNPRLDMGAAATAKEFRAVLAEALEGAVVEETRLKVIRDRAANKRIAG